MEGRAGKRGCCVAAGNGVAARQEMHCMECWCPRCCGVILSCVRVYVCVWVRVCAGCCSCCLLLMSRQALNGGLYMRVSSDTLYGHVGTKGFPCPPRKGVSTVPIL